MFKRTLFLMGLLVFGATLSAAQPNETARLRAANYVVDSAPLAVTVDGEPLTTEPLAFTSAAAHIEIPVGTHEIAFADGDEIIASVTHDFEANADYTAALIGQFADESAQIVMIGETALIAGLRDPRAPASYAILLHGISNGPTVDFMLDGETLRAGLTFGEYDVFRITQEPHDILVTFSDDPTQVLFQNQGETPPANDLVLLTVMAGAYPDALDVTGAVSRLPDRSVLDFLRTAQAADGTGFSTLMRALELTGLSETLSTEGVYTLFAPTDAAFEALAPETRDLLFAYPEALRAVLLGHVVDEVFVLRDFSGEQTVTSRQGTEIVLRAEGDDIRVNDNAALLFGGFPVVTNGNVIGIDRLLIPDSAR